MFFSIIVTIYNGEAFLTQCLDSILKNSAGNYELIIIDDGSTDGTGVICEDYEGRHDHVRYVRTPNRGIGNARQAGIEAASGEYIIFVDGDDLWDESFKLCKLEEEIEKSCADLYIFGYVLRRINRDGFSDSRYTLDASTFEDWRDNQERFLSYFPNGLMFFCWNKIFRRQCIVDNNVTSVQQHMEDFRFVLDFLKVAGKVVFLSGEYYIHMKRGIPSLVSTTRHGMLEGQNICHNLFLSLFDAEYEAQIHQIMASAYLGTVCRHLSLIEKREDEAKSLNVLDDIHENDLAQMAFRHYHPSSFSEKVSFFLVRNGRFSSLRKYRKLVSAIKKLG